MGEIIDTYNNWDETENTTVNFTGWFHYHKEFVERCFPYTVSIRELMQMGFYAGANFIQDIYSQGKMKTIASKTSDMELLSAFEFGFRQHDLEAAMENFRKVRKGGK